MLERLVLGDDSEISVAFLIGNDEVFFSVVELCVISGTGLVYQTGKLSEVV